ncbi:MAG: hypothetical protein SNH27_06910 [Rikenellaceae bacterium]
MKLLKTLFKIYSPSKREGKMKRFIKKYIKTNIPNCTISGDQAGNLYITKGITEEYPAIVAHLDQVHSERSHDFRAIETNELILGYSKHNRQQENLGADDKVGIFIALRALERFENLKVTLFVNEESGCIGSGQSDLSFFDDCRFLIQCDRKGSKDLVTSIYGVPLCSEEFISDIGAEQFGYAECEGGITDVGELKQRGLQISCINLSCGYYSPHSSTEFVVKSDILQTLKFVEHIIENCTKVYPHKEQNLWDSENRYSNPNFIDEYFEIEMIVEELYDLDSTITADEIFSEYYEIYKSIKLEDIEDMLFSQNRRCLNY